MPATPVMGQIMPFAGTVVPRGWAVCNGALLAVQNNTALFSLLGTRYGGDGIRTFALPDLRGRAIMGADAAGLCPPGMSSGTPTVVLDLTEIPSHQHGISASTKPGSGGRGASTPTGNIFATNTTPTSNPTKILLVAGNSEVPLSVGTNVLASGSSAAHENMQPYLTISYLIAMQGTYPSRN
ncbi:MAG: tail fiber protein [Tardiphaga sp.]